MITSCTGVGNRSRTLKSLDIVNDTIAVPCENGINMYNRSLVTPWGNWLNCSCLNDVLKTQYVLPQSVCLHCWPLSSLMTSNLVLMCLLPMTEWSRSSECGERCLCRYQKCKSCTLVVVTKIVKNVLMYWLTQISKRIKLDIKKEHWQYISCLCVFLQCVTCFLNCVPLM